MSLNKVDGAKLKSIIRTIGQHPIPIFLLTLLASAIMILDSIIVNVYLNIPREPLPLQNAYLFTILVIIFILVNFMLLAYAHAGLSRFKKSMPIISHTNKMLLFSQLTIVGSLIIMSIHVLGYRLNENMIISFVIYLSSITSICFLILLNYQFFKWYFSKRNILILLYGIAFVFVVSSLITSLVYLGTNLSHYDSDIRLTYFKIQISNYTNYGESLNLLTNLYNYLSILSFVTLWIPSVYLLKSYAIRLGEVKYYILVTIPMIYFVLPFLVTQYGLFDQFMSEYDSKFNLIYYYLFSPYKQVGGLLFGIVFWLTASRIKRENLKILVRIAGLGMMVLFGSMVIHGLTYLVSPPFGVVTIGFLPIASYLLLLGILSSTMELSIDSKIRRELQKTGKQFALLDSISKAQVERSVLNTVRQVVKETSGKDTIYADSNMLNEDYLEYAKEIMNEIKRIKDEGMTLS